MKPALVAIVAVTGCALVAGVDGDYEPIGDAGGMGTAGGDGGEGGAECPARPVGMGCPMPPCTNCPEDGVCNIDCADCTQTPIIECPAGFACNFTCTEQQGCEGVTLVCAADHACTLSCPGQDTCRDTVLECSNAATCVVTCSDRACDDFLGATCATGAPITDCFPSCSCNACP